MADEQVGNNSWITMTPGSAVAGQLQQILTTKRLEARQAMLDQLNAKNVESQIADRDQNAETNQMWRQSLADEHASREEGRLAQETTRRASLYSPGQNLAGSDLEFFQKNAPSTVDPGQPETPQFDYEGQAPTPATGAKFHGLPAQLETQRKTQMQQEAIKILQDSEKMKLLSPAQQSYVYEQATLHASPVGLFKDKGDSWGPVFDANGQDTGNWAPGNAHFLQREPKDPTPPGMTPFQGENVETGDKVSLGYNPRTNSYEPSKIPAGLRITEGSRNNAAPRNGIRPPKVTPNTWGLWSQAVDKVLKGNTAVEGDLNAQAARIAQELGLSQHAAQAALDTFRNPQNRTRSPKFAPADGATAAEAAQSQELWNLITAGFKQAPQQ